MSDAWVGLVGALVGASAGVGGVLVTSWLRARHDLNGEIRRAAAELIARARYPAYASQALKHELVDRDDVSELFTRWGEEMARAHTNLVVIADAEVVGAGDILWHRSTDHLLALLGEPNAGDDAESLQVEVEQLIWQLQEEVTDRYGAGSIRRRRALD